MSGDTTMTDFPDCTTSTAAITADEVPPYMITSAVKTFSGVFVLLHPQINKSKAKWVIILLVILYEF
jgi:hypothetical protein